MNIKKINHRKWLRSAFTLLAVALCLSAYADGEQRYHEAGTKWLFTPMEPCPERDALLKDLDERMAQMAAEEEAAIRSSVSLF